MCWLNDPVISNPKQGRPAKTLNGKNGITSGQATEKRCTHLFSSPLVTGVSEPIPAVPGREAGYEDNAISIWSMSLFFLNATKGSYSLTLFLMCPWIPPVHVWLLYQYINSTVCESEPRIAVQPPSLPIQLSRFPFSIFIILWFKFIEMMWTYRISVKITGSRDRLMCHSLFPPAHFWTCWLLRWLIFWTRSLWGCVKDMIQGITFHLNFCMIQWMIYIIKSIYMP